MAPAEGLSAPALLETGGLCARIALQQHEGKWLVPDMQDAEHLRVEYGSEPFEWEVLPCPHGGGSLIRCMATAQGEATGRHYYWQIHKHGGYKLCLIPWGKTWETFFFRLQGERWAIRSFISERWLCAQPSNMTPRLVADRLVVQRWEEFDVRIVRTT